MKKNNAFPAANASEPFADVLYYKGQDIMLKVQDYIPPMKEELAEQYMAIDTWNRELKLPKFFYDYFMETFMVPAYTCD